MERNLKGSLSNKFWKTAQQEEQGL
ncbi:hypothetical protein LUU34_00129900 [Aix galericulata]|nr:hypothetical protein LUU34_00129900 [Aix galericulata]